MAYHKYFAKHLQTSIENYNSVSNVIYDKDWTYCRKYKFKLKKNSSCVELKNNRFKYARNNSENAM